MMTSILRVRLTKFAVLGLVCLLLSGCFKTKVTKANFDQINNDMTLEQVENILGEGTKMGGDGANVAASVGVDIGSASRAPANVDYVWEKGDKSITVTFRQGKVVGKKSTGL